MSSGNKQINATTVKLGIYETSTDAQLVGMLGQKKELEDGRKFVLCKAGEALAAGYLTQMPAQDDEDDELVVNTAAAIGDKEIEVTVTTAHGGYDEDELKDGFLCVTLENSSDEGTFYKIKGNDAFVADATATIFLYDGLTTILTATDNEVAVCLNPFKDVVIDANSSPLAGVPYLAVDSGAYFWNLCEGFGPGIDGGSGGTAGGYVLHLAGEVNVATSAERAIGVIMSDCATDEGVIVKYFPMH